MKVNQHALIGIAFLIGAFCSVAPSAADDDFEHGLLFEVRGAPQGACYLFGTIHSEDKRVLDLPPVVAAAFDGSKTFVMEVIPDAEAIISSMMTMVYTDGRTLEQVIGRSLYARTLEAAASIGMSEAAIQDFKPWALATLLGLPPAQTGEFLDMYLYERAKAAGKEVAGLESIQEQLAVLDDFTEDEQIILLRETLEVLDRLPEVFEHLIATYLQRDLAELLRLSDEYLRGGDKALAQKFKAAALEVRNARMARRLDPYIRQGGCFVAVGALHLPGDGGLLERLDDAGYLVRTLY